MDNLDWPVQDTQVALDTKSLGRVNHPVSVLSSSYAQHYEYSCKRRVSGLTVS